jgi:hypothetical protein
MADTESLRQAMQSRAPFSSWLGIVLLFVLFGAIVLALIGPMPRGDDYEQTRARKRMESLQKLRKDDDEALNTYSWVDKNKGVVRVPISRAMELTVTELAKKKPVPAYAIATPEAQAAPGGTAVASPAPSPSPVPSGTPKPTSVSGPNSEARGQPAAAVNPPPAPSGTQPGTSAAPAAKQSAAPSASPAPGKTP